MKRAYRDLERHDGFVADPAKVGEASHKGNVERVVPVVRYQVIAGRDFRDSEEANQRALTGCMQEIGMEIHGTTQRQPYEVFRTEEQPRLKPLPRERFEFPLWKRCTVHPDHHIVFDHSDYSLISNRPPQDWIPLFPDPVMADSALDRVARHLILEDESYRKKLTPKPLTPSLPP